MKQEALASLVKVWEFLYSIYPALFWQVVFYFYRDYKFKRVFSYRIFSLHVFITVGIATLTIKWISLFELYSRSSLADDLKYFIIFIAGGFSMKLIDMLDKYVPEKLEYEAEKYLKKKS